MSVDTAPVARPSTGFPFLDQGLDQPGSVLAFAHRGGAFHPAIKGLENTMAAFQHAFELGYRYLETDVHLTRDGMLLAFHDARLARVTGHRGTIADLDYAEVTEALIGGREQIPTMASLFAQFPEARFNIDIKAQPAVAPLAALVDSMDVHERVCVSSFSERRISQFRSLAGARVATAAGPLGVAMFRLLPATALLGVLARNPAAALQVPHRRGRVTVATPALIAAAHALGKHVHVWTVDDPEQMRDLLDLGVDGLMTDRTDLLRDVLLARGQWMGATP